MDPQGTMTDAPPTTQMKTTMLMVTQMWTNNYCEHKEEGGEDLRGKGGWQLILLYYSPPNPLNLTEDQMEVRPFPCEASIDTSLGGSSSCPHSIRYQCLSNGTTLVEPTTLADSLTLALPMTLAELTTLTEPMTLAIVNIKKKKEVRT